MQGRIANCPNCGGQVEFKAGSSLLAICSYCSSAVARTGGDVGELEILGKVAPLAALSSPLSLGARGRYRGRDFALIGRIQLDYGLGPWNEWYASFEDGSWGWVAEAQGRVYITFEKSASRLPNYQLARVGATVKVAGRTLSIVERRKAKFIAAEGELPHPIIPGREYKYCDLEGPEGTFGTIDYGTRDESETLYLGEQLKYSDLFAPSMLRDVAAESAAGAVGMNCPNCGFAIELRAPDEAQRVTCGACSSLLDCSRESGSALRLLAAAQRTGPELLIPLGAKGKLRGGNYVVYGHLLKGVTIDGMNYYWEEYLLRGSVGYRWLVVSDYHWSFVEPVSAGEISASGRGARFRDESYRHFQSASARVEALQGEFYWKVSVGERTLAADYVNPPKMLSREATDEEVTWSLGHYLEAGEVEQAFGLKTKLQRPRSAGAAQPNHWKASISSMSRVGLGLSALLVVFAAITAFASGNEQVLSQDFAMIAASAGRSTGVAGASQPFEVKERGAIALSIDRPQDAAWLYVSGNLIEQNTQLSRPFGIYAAASAAETDFSSRRKTVYLGEVPPGTYVAHLTPEWSAARPSQFRFEVHVDPFFQSHVLLALLLIWVFPIFPLVGYFNFEKQRWSESDYG